MRILIATPLYPPESGGPATYTKVLEERFPAQDVEVTVVKFADVRKSPKVIRHLRYFFKLLRAGKRADLILALDPVSVGLPAAYAARILRKPFVVKVVGDYAWEQGRQRSGVTESLDDFVHDTHVPPLVELLRFVQTHVARAATRIIVPSAYLKGIVTAWGIPSENITVIHNAVSFEEGGVVPEAVSALARPRVVSAGRLVPWKGMGGLINAMVEVRQKLPEASLVIVGDGPDRSHLESYARARLDSGYLFTGPRSHADTLAIIKDADMFVLNTAYEGLSHLLIEAMALGVPIITTPVGGNVELIRDRTEGILVPHGEPDALAQAIIDLMPNEALRTFMSQSARSAAAAFTEEAMVAKTLELFASLV